MCVGIVGFILTLWFWESWWGGGYFRRTRYASGQPGYDYGASPWRRPTRSGYVVEEEDVPVAPGRPTGRPAAARATRAASSVALDPLQRLVDLGVRDRQRRRRRDQRAVLAGGDDEHAAREASSQSPGRARSRPAPCQPARSKRSPGARHAVEQPRHLVEDDERRRAGERVADVRVRVDVLRPELPELLEAVAEKSAAESGSPPPSALPVQITSASSPERHSSPVRPSPQ